MPAGSRPRHEPSDDWNQLRLLVTSPEEEGALWMLIAGCKSTPRHDFLATCLHLAVAELDSVPSWL